MTALLQKALDSFGSLSQLVQTIIVGSELEFYLPGMDENLLHIMSDKLANKCNIIKEESDGQYELQFPPTNEPLILADNMVYAKETINSLAKIYGLNALFDAKPFKCMAGSGMHIHINFLINDKNLFAREDGGLESTYLKYAVGGLCVCMKGHMRYFAPNNLSYARFEHPDIYTPTKISWGNNNRTTAIRIPDTNNMPHIRRLEHRVPGADSNPYDVIAAILIGVQHGITHRIEPPKQTYGLAFDQQYGLESLPKSLKEALKFESIE